MKNLIIALVLLTSLAFTSEATAQKFGHINSNELLLAFPQRDTAEAKVKAFTLKRQKQIERMQIEAKSIYDNYLATKGNMSTTERESVETEITDLQERIQDAVAKAENDIVKLEQELLEPMIQSAREAIKAVGKENGYTYIFDVSTGAIVYDGGTDVMNLVKKKLGLAVN